MSRPSRKSSHPLKTGSQSHSKGSTYSTDSSTGTTVVRPRLSLCMIVKNEQRFLRNCLESAKEIVDEIVIVDTGSTDGTLDIAREYGAKIVQHTWNDDFSEARNISLHHATGDWALWLDADEEIAPECRQAFRKAVDSAPAQVGAYLVRLHNWMSSFQRLEGSECIVHHAARLFRRLPGVRFQGRIHEQHLPSLAGLGYTYLSAPHLILDHFGYVGEVRDEKQKNERTIRLLTREVEECPVPEMQGFQHFNLGLAYSVVGDTENAARYMALAAENPDPDQEHTNLLFSLYAMVQQQRERPEEGLIVCAQADALGIQQPGLEFARGHCYRALNRLDEAVHAFRAAIAYGERDQQREHSVGDVGLGSFKARYALALTLRDLERNAEAIEQCERALEESDGLVAARYLLADLLVQDGRTSEACQALRRLLHYQPDHTDSLRALGMLLLAEQEYAEALPLLQQAIQDNPEEYDTLARLALCCEQMGQNNDAQRHYEALRRLDPASPEVCINLGRILTQNGQPGEAIACFADAIELDPHYPNAYFNLGDLLYQLGYYDRAAETYVAGLRLDPVHEAGFFVLGNCYFQTGNYAAAVESYQQALTRNPQDPRARHNLELAAAQNKQAA